MTEEGLDAQILKVRALPPAGPQRFVRQVEGVLEDRQPRHQPGRHRRHAWTVRIDRAETLLQLRPINRSGQPHQHVVHVDVLVEPGAEQILLTGLAPLVWPGHRRRQSTESRFVPHTNRKMKLQGNSQPTGCFLQSPNDYRGCAASLFSSLPIVHG